MRHARVVVGRLVQTLCVATCVFSAVLAQAVEIEVRGIVSPKPALLAEALEDDDDLLRFSAPYSSDERLSEAAAEKARLALQRLGYAEPEATASVDRAEGSRTVVIDVVPGERLTAGDILVDGLPDPVAERLIEWLTTPQPPASAQPRIVDAGNAREIEWLNDQGRPVRMKPPMWTPGEPAALDAPFTDKVRGLVVRFLREEGYLVAAEQVKKRRGDGLTIAVAAATDAADTATLTLRFETAPVAATLRDLAIRGADGVSPEAIQAFLGVATGEPVSEADRREWEESLRLSGRFIRHGITLQTDSQSHRDGSVTALVDLLPYPRVTPIDRPPSREEQTMLRFRSWLQESLDGDGIELQLTAADGTEIGACVLSAEHGVVLRVGGDGPDAGAIAVTDAGLGVFVAGHGGRFEVPLASLGQAVVLASLSVRDTLDPEKGTYRHDLSLGASFGSSSSEHDPAAVVSAKIAPVACLALVHRQEMGDADEADVRWNGTTLEITSGGGIARIDEKSGRLLELDMPNFGRIAVAAAGSWETRLADLRSASGENGYRPAEPVSSAIAFFGSEGARQLTGRIVSLLDLGKADNPMHDSLQSLAAAIVNAAADGGFEDVDANVAAFLKREPSHDELPEIPSKVAEKPAGDPIMFVLAKLSGKAWAWLDESCGHDAWPTGLARLANAVLRQEGATIFQEVAVFMGSEKSGPLAHLVASSLIPMKPVASSFAMRGQARVSEAAFRADCVPVLTILEKTGLDLAVVAVARRLDEQQATRMGDAWFGSGGGFAACLAELRAAESDRAAVGAVPESLTAWWQTSLRETVSLALQQRGGGARMAAGTSDGDTGLTR